MDWGLENRLSRIIQKDGRTLMFAVDHGYFLGAIKGLKKPKRMLNKISLYADAVMLTKGMATHALNPTTTKPIILRADGGPSIAGEINEVSKLSDHRMMSTIEDAIRINASAIAISIFVGTEHEAQTMQNLSKTVIEAEKYNIPVLAVTAVGRNLDELKEDSRYLSLACRMASEYGANIVKTYYCSKGFEDVTGGCLSPVVMAGGKSGDPLGALEQAYNAVKKGAIGVDMGRNIFQAKNPDEMIMAVESIIHGSMTHKQAYEQYIKR